ncbi:MAG: stage 0 sporulation protein [Clostridia bacterium]|nr:stage 0 sporulation protein [Clostridia bacterium]
MVEYVGIKFNDGGKMYYFSPGEGEEYVSGDKVIVETARGVECATVCVPRGEVDESTLPSPLRPVMRKATDEDLAAVERNEKRRPELSRLFLEKVEKHGLPMKLVTLEIAFDGTKVTYFFSAEKRVDFRDFVKDLSSGLHLRVELRQIGIRDEIKLLGGTGPCGMVCCCCGCMQDFKKVSVKMAKNQGLSLNPTKTSGYCGRLMCCLAYEDYYYSSVCKMMPKTGSEVTTPDGKGTVVNVDMLRMRVKVRISGGDFFKYGDYSLDEISFPRKQAAQTAAEEGAEDEPEDEADVFMPDAD